MAQQLHQVSSTLLVWLQQQQNAALTAEAQRMQGLTQLQQVLAKLNARQDALFEALQKSESHKVLMAETGNAPYSGRREEQRQSTQLDDLTELFGSVDEPQSYITNVER
eukprot:9629296-Karenia_brevis.AAC.1